ncbi:MSHA biogenesis protein mshL [Vibrio sp. JCM 19236]|nr:MSHA biogenesis protein mshL [Vibrio sp. JCM 19236]
MDVTPQIDDKGNVLLHVHPAVIEVTTEEKTIDLGELQALLPCRWRRVLYVNRTLLSAPLMVMLWLSVA